MTTQAQHTPGEWTVVPFLKDNNGKPLNFTVRSSEREIADVYNKPNTHGTEAEANAHLMAASPDLYEALKNMMLASNCTCAEEGHLILNDDDPDRLWCDWHKANAAIAKAEGR